MASNIQTVQSIYAAFGRGDIPAILSDLAVGVEWEYGILDAGVPWLQTRGGFERPSSKAAPWWLR